MSDWTDQLEDLGLSKQKPSSLTLQDLITAFRRTSLVQIPGKHMSLPNNHLRFAKLNRSFVQVIHYSLLMRRGQPFYPMAITRGEVAPKYEDKTWKRQQIPDFTSIIWSTMNQNSQKIIFLEFSHNLIQR